MKDKIPNHSRIDTFQLLVHLIRLALYATFQVTKLSCSEYFAKLSLPCADEISVCRTLAHLEESSDRYILYCIVLIALSRCNRVFTRRLRLCHSHTVYRREVRKGDREGPNRVESEV